jgi:squalene synthase HpnC
LRRTLTELGLQPRHAYDLLDAFRLDVRKRRYATWRELMDYCRLSAMPVGRFVLDVHRETQETWLASDPLCAALQVINHLQDCAKDYRQLDRVYLPQDALAANGASTEMLAAARSTPALLEAIRDLARRASALLRDAEPLFRQVRNARLSLEIAAIQTLAEHLVRRLAKRDPLSESVHMSKLAFIVFGGLGVLRCLG